ncbi:MAG: hypothetical protein NDJ94_17135 [Vicinamibacteria bacterium]|nr:hypothetical protein [Vicinamibacteria bacterium]
MKLPRVLALLAAAAFACAAPALLAQAPAADKAPEKGKLELGLWTSSVSGSPDLAAEFESADETLPLGVLELNLKDGRNRLKLFSQVLGADDMRHVLSFDIGKAVRSLTTYDRFPVRLGHDPMSNLEAASKNGRIVWHTDLDPDRRYEQVDAILDHRTEVRPAGRLALGFFLRDQRRSGHHQSLTISHCDTCHVYSQTRVVKQRQTEVGIDGRWQWKTGALEANLSQRQLRNDAAGNTLVYDRALHPETRLPIFDNRVLFDSLNGAVPVDSQPETDRTQGRIELNVAELAGFDVTATGAFANTKNRGTEIESDYQGGTLLVSRELRERLSMRLRARAYSASSDGYAIDFTERAAIAGPQAGKTYRQVYGYDPDYVRASALDRDAYEAGAELVYKLPGKAGTLRGRWDYEDVDRDNVLVAVDGGRTRTHELGLSWRARPASHVKLAAEWRYGSVDAPYGVVDGACAPLADVGPLPSPLAPGSIQYFQVHDARVGDTTASPDTWNDLRASATVSKARVGATATLRYWDGSNDSGDLTDWARSRTTVTATAWFAPEERWDAWFAWSHEDGELQSHVCTPMFDG